MAITSLDEYIAAARQVHTIRKIVNRPTLAASWFSMLDIAGDPGAGVLPGTNQTSGVIPVAGDAGFPSLVAFASGAKGYLSRVDYSNSVACRMRIVDVLWKGGAYPFNAAVTLSTQPDISNRLPQLNGVPLWNETEIWIETATAATGNQTWSIAYTNQSDVTGKQTGVVGIGAAPTIGRMWKMPFAAGDVGVKKIESVTGGTGTVGTANVLIVRPLWTGRIFVANDGSIHGLDRTGMVEVFQNSALLFMLSPDSTASGMPEIQLEVCSA